MEKEILNQLMVAVKSKGYTHKELAEKLGVSSGQVFNILNGRTKLTFKRLVQIMRVLEIEGEIKINNTTIKVY